MNEYLDILEGMYGDAVFVRLSQQKAMRRFCSLIDREDFERVTRSKWSLRIGGSGVKYAHATTDKYLPRHHMKLSAFIVKAERGQIVDHISGDGLDNRKQNLRIVTNAENSRNSKRQTFVGKTSRFKGVCWERFEAKYLAQIMMDGQSHYLGLFLDEIDAARAYDEAALRLFGQHARTNAMMNLFEQADPDIPDCSRGARRCHQQKPKPRFEPTHKYNNAIVPKDFKQKRALDERLMQEIAEFEKSGKLPKQSSQAPRR